MKKNKIIYLAKILADDVLFPYVCTNANNHDMAQPIGILVKEILARIKKEETSLGATQKAEPDHRLSRHDGNAMNYFPWGEVKLDLRSKPH